MSQNSKFFKMRSKISLTSHKILRKLCWRHYNAIQLLSSSDNGIRLLVQPGRYKHYYSAPQRTSLVFYTYHVAVAPDNIFLPSCKESCDIYALHDDCFKLHQVKTSFFFLCKTVYDCTISTESFLYSSMRFSCSFRLPVSRGPHSLGKTHNTVSKSTDRKTATVQS